MQTFLGVCHAFLTHKRHPKVCGAGTRDELLRRSAWKANTCLVIKFWVSGFSQGGFIKKKDISFGSILLTLIRWSFFKLSKRTFLFSWQAGHTGEGRGFGLPHPPPPATMLLMIMAFLCSYTFVSPYSHFIFPITRPYSCFAAQRNAFRGWIYWIK